MIWVKDEITDGHEPVEAQIPIRPVLVGGENFQWKGTPLHVLYEKHIKAGKGRKSAIKAAARDLGWLVKSVLSEDKRTFEVGKGGLVRTYRWVGNEP